MSYKRLTERVRKSIAIKETSTNDNKSIWNAIERLAELEDKIENRTLVEFPCKVGDDFWYITMIWDISGKFIGKIYHAKVAGFYIADGLIQIEDNLAYNYYNYLGDAFLTKAEAEKRLKELRDEH